MEPLRPRERALDLHTCLLCHALDALKNLHRQWSFHRRYPAHRFADRNLRVDAEAGRLINGLYLGE